MIDVDFWTQPQLVSIGRLPATSIDRRGTDNAIDAGGRWRFDLLRRPSDAPSGWTSAGFDDSGWRHVDVPGCWTMQGTWDTPHYTNIVLPAGLKPPAVPDENPTGLYRRRVALPSSWAGRRVVLSVGGAESALLVHAGGRFVGASKGSRLPAEFELPADVVAAGGVDLALEVVKWSDASHVEEQDHWWHGGITRDVHLYATDARAWIADVDVRPSLDVDLGTGHVDARVTVGNTARSGDLGGLPAGWQVTVSVDGIGTGTGTVPVDDAMPYTFRGHVAAVRLSGPVEPWTAETPRLHHVEVSLVDPEGVTVETVRTRVGFRRVEIAGTELLVNGQPVLIRGVNHHDFDRRTGRVVDPGDMRADIVLLKQFGFNAIRTSHYPPDPVFLDLCDELGMYVVDEADIEAHASWGSLCHDARYTAAFVDRVGRMVVRDRNHPSVLLWSLGNETGYGANHDAAAALARRLDPTRPLHYEGAITGHWDRGHHATDVVCPMYPTIDAIVSWAESGKLDRPLIMCEYSHAMGNSNGCLAEYWDAIERTPGLQGGFVWEFWDHGLEQTLDDGTVRWTYGGDWGDEPNDGNFCLDGMVWPDRRPKPAMWEHKQLAAPVTVTAAGSAGLEVRNRQWFTTLDWLAADFEVEVDGEVVERGPMPLPDIEPQRSVTVALPTAPGARGPGETWLTIRFTARHDLPWCDAGYEVCWSQLLLGDRRRDHPGSTAALDAATVVRPPRLALWRAPVDNDRIPGRARQWEEWGIDRLERHVVETSSTAVRSRYTAPGNGAVVEHTIAVLVEPETGTVLVEEAAVVPDELADLPRVGTELWLATPSEAVTWFGPGPVETYPDRRRGGAVARWVSNVGDEYVPYVRPQENGGHADVRWFDIGGARFDLDEPRQVSFTHFAAADLARATHDVELVPRPEVVVHIDAAHRGVGTHSCGPDTLEVHRVRPGIYRWSWRVAGGHDLAAALLA